MDEANYIGTAILNDLKILFNFEMDSRDRAVIFLVGNSANLNIITADAVMQAISDCELG